MPPLRRPIRLLRLLIRRPPFVMCCCARIVAPAEGVPVLVRTCHGIRIAVLIGFSTFSGQ